MFHFKQFSIDDAHCAMKVGTDSVLLGASVNISEAFRILDVGCGSGILSLMAAQRNELCKITAIELDEAAVKDAESNFANSKWSERINLQHIKFQIFAINTDSKYDLILCNPPFFSKSLKANGNQRNMARHDDSLPHDEFLAGASKLLQKNGSIVVIIPFESQQKWLLEATLQGLYLKKQSVVKSSTTHPPHRLIVELTNEKPFEIIDSEIIIYSEKGIYSKQYKELCKEFYLHF